MASNDESKLTAAVEAVAKVVPTEKVYEDALQPAAKAFGEAAAPTGAHLGRSLSTMAALVSVPFDALRLFAVDGPKKLGNWLARRLDARAVDDPQAPPLALAGPALMGLAFTQDEPRLRAMFLELLASSMDPVTSADAHPSFADAIRQMSPSDARLVRLLASSDGIRQAMRFRCVKVTSKGDGWGRDDTLIDIELGEDIAADDPLNGDLLGVAVDSLVRLGIAELTFQEYRDTPEVYERMTARNSEWISARTAIGMVERNARGQLRVTMYGAAFINACVDLETPEEQAWTW